jgi:hypothetical protein
MKTLLYPKSMGNLAAAVDIAQLKRGTDLFARMKIVGYLRVFGEGLDREAGRAV